MYVRGGGGGEGGKTRQGRQGGIREDHSAGFRILVECPPPPCAQCAQCTVRRLQTRPAPVCPVCPVCRDVVVLHCAFFLIFGLGVGMPVGYAGVCQGHSAIVVYAFLLTLCVFGDRRVMCLSAALGFIWFHLLRVVAVCPISSLGTRKVGGGSPSPNEWPARRRRGE